MDETSHPTPGYDQGRSHIWTAETIRAIHAKAELGRYQIRGFSTFQKLPTLDDLVFLPAVMTRLPLEGYREHCETKTWIGGGRPDLVSEPLELAFPVYLTSMSFGALGTNAKRALGMGFSRAGLATCTGEGGMLPEEREASDRLIYQMTPSRYGLDLEHLRTADAIEIVLGQGAKPGTGGMLLGMKVSEKVAEMRTLPVGVDQRSAARHPDFLGGDDLAVKIEELREATDYRVPIILKLAACRVEQDVKIAAKTGCDAIVVDGTEGSTAASPEFQLDHTGVPTLTAIPAARRALEDIGMYGKITLIASGGIRSGVDAAKALALGADCVAIGTAALMAAGCNSPVSVGGVDAAEGYAALGTSAGACHHCHTGRCPVGVTTQDPELEARLDPELGAERVHNFLTSMYYEMTILAKSCGKGNIHNLEPEDLRALSLEASAFTGVPLAGVDWVVGPGTFGG
jgi:glutamate synthase domain-containing protein 2